MLSRVGKVALGVLPLVAIVGVTTLGQAEEAPPAARNLPGVADRTSTATVRASNSPAGAAFAMTNVAGRNRIIEYRRAADGRLTRVGSVWTRGSGIGVDLDTQGAVRLSEDHRFLYATNAGSDTVSVFSVQGTSLTFLQKVYAGDQPNSLTLHEDLLYVLDGSVAGNGILGFKVASNGTLTPLRGSFRELSSPIAVPGQVEFSPHGRLILVTHKTTNVLLSPSNAIDVFRVWDSGLTSAVPKRRASHGLRPFSLAFRDDGKLVVAEAFNAAPGRSAVSSYQVSSRGDLAVRSGSVRNFRTDTCWIVITDDGRYVFTANFGDGTISSYRFSESGELRLIKRTAAFLGALSQPVDLALSDDSRYLYLLLRGTGGVAAFEIGYGGRLEPRGVVTGELPVADGASGMDAY